MTDKKVAKVTPLEWDMTWETWSQKVWPAFSKERKNWTMEKTYDLMHALVKTARTLKMEAGTALPLRSSAYRMVDTGLIHSHPSSAATNLGYAMAWLRDYGYIGWDLFSDDSVGQDARGFTPEELEERIRNARRNNVPPVLIDGYLSALWVEKAGLIPYLRKATRFQVPVGSPEGNIRKSWAHENWIPNMLQLVARLGGELRLVYLGDGDEPGRQIYERTNEWLMWQFDIALEHYAVTDAQLREVHRGEVHLDGYIPLVKPEVFAKRLRDYLSLPAT